MKTTLTTLAFLLSLASLLKAQYIAEVHAYVPGPGQLINETPWGTPASANSIVGDLNGTLCLGAFGGYVVFAFDQPILNHPDNPFGVDFTLFGNPNPTWSEPGIVWVMKDENENGQPDDTWYELAGSDHWFSSTITGYTATYTNPGGTQAMDVPWADNFGNSGFVFANDFHDHSFYPLNDSFPEIPENQYQLSGTYLAGAIDSTDPGFVKSHTRAFGYADNHSRGVVPYSLPDNPYTPETENAGGDAFDISWAVDGDGNYIDLDEAHFVKVQSAMLANGGWLGEISTEITGASLVVPDPAVNGTDKLIVIKDLPQVIRQESFPLEAFVFFSGKLQPDEPITWETNKPWASVDNNSVLKATQNGDVEITATLENYPEISTTIGATIALSTSINNPVANSKKPVILPNPASSQIRIDGLENAGIKIFDHTGNLIKSIKTYSGENLSVENLPSGFYLIQFADDHTSGSVKLIVR